MNAPEHWMRAALEQARYAAQCGEVPVGCVIVSDSGSLLARAHNEVETLLDPTAHAEVLAIRRASVELGKWRLVGCSVYVTLEPCPMCMGALLAARVSSVYFAASDSIQGAAGSIFDLGNIDSLPRQIEIVGGVCREESEILLQEFFLKLREGKGVKTV